MAPQCLALAISAPKPASRSPEGKETFYFREMFADIDVFDIELAETDPDKIIQNRQTRAHIWHQCLNIRKRRNVQDEQTLKRDEHSGFDDQHALCVITGAGFLNACEIASRKHSDCTRFSQFQRQRETIACGLYVALGVNVAVFMFVQRPDLQKGTQRPQQVKAKNMPSRKKCTLAKP